MTKRIDYPAQAYHGFSVSSFEQQTQSLDFPGSQALSGSASSLGITTTFSAAIWAKNEDVVASGVLAMFKLGPNAGSDASSIRMSTANNSNTNLVVRIADDAFSVRQLAQWDGAIDGNTDTWHHFVLTWNGAADGLQLYIDGSLTAATTVTTNLDSGSGIADSSRRIDVGGANLYSAWEGPIYSAAFYDSVLSSSQISAMYNSGAPLTVNLMGLGVKPLHYYRVGLGSDDTEFGQDRGVSADVDLTNANLTSSNLTSDIPT